MCHSSRDCICVRAPGIFSRNAALWTRKQVGRRRRMRADDDDDDVDDGQQRGLKKQKKRKINGKEVVRFLFTLLPFVLLSSLSYIFDITCYILLYHIVLL